MRAVSAAPLDANQVGLSAARVHVVSCCARARARTCAHTRHAAPCLSSEVDAVLRDEAGQRAHAPDPRADPRVRAQRQRALGRRLRERDVGEDGNVRDGRRGPARDPLLARRGALGEARLERVLGFLGRLEEAAVEVLFSKVVVLFLFVVVVMPAPAAGAGSSRASSGSSDGDAVPLGRDRLDLRLQEEPHRRERRPVRVGPQEAPQALEVAVRQQI